MARVVLGVAGGIAAYKACELLRLLTESGHSVRVVPTEAALRFVGEPTWAALSGQPVASDVWRDAHEVPHVSIGQEADLVLVAPATADLLAKAAHGLADDLLTNTLLTARCPVVLAPAMHTEMWEHPGDSGECRDPPAAWCGGHRAGHGPAHRSRHGQGAPARARRRSSRWRSRCCVEARRAPPLADLAGRHVVVTAGGTREPLDPVRFLGNRSSGRQGYAFARTAVARGAEVTLISANVSLPEPAGVTLVAVGSTEELRKATLDASARADVVIMAAAPADFRPAEYAETKIKKAGDGSAPVLQLVTNPDIAAELGERKPPGQILVAFAAETGSALANARVKLAAKKADLIVVNEVGPDKVFGKTTNAVTVLAADGSVTELPEAPKEDIADAVWDLIAARLR